MKPWLATGTDRKEWIAWGEDKISASLAFHDAFVGDLATLVRHTEADHERPRIFLIRPFDSSNNPA